MKIAVSGERLGRALPPMLNSSINYLRPVSVNNQDMYVHISTYSRNIGVRVRMAMPTLSHLVPLLAISYILKLNHCTDLGATHTETV